ncbi:unnamed protein product [Macrosiphum euphorbiae]|uniref:Uncharacterized protein n=1 Tax=Macrosiphum euphorbiae TaxID=13131 RepID=A0AAV0X4R7_9HEMI|nr:unnamed protein product [Macrosiphum euphorbiae]
MFTPQIFCEEKSQHRGKLVENLLQYSQAPPLEQSKPYMETIKSLGMPDDLFEALTQLKTTSTKSFNFSNTLTCTTSSRKTIICNHICSISI